MLSTAVVLALLALALAWPVPILLSRAHWPSRAPGTALALWQSIALAGGLSMIGALLLYGLIPFGAALPDSLAGLGRSLLGAPLPVGSRFDHVFALCSALVLTVHLLLNLAMTIVRSERQRRRHRQLIDLLAFPMPDRPRTRILDHAAPVAYCLPGASRSVTVLSAGLLELLGPDELRGVIAHETAHLRQQHHAVLLAFKSWHSALPWFPIANRAENAVALLVEMLADDQARRVVPDRTLARAIALVGAAGQPGEVPDARALSAEPDHGPDLVSPRVRRLLAPPSRLPIHARTAVLAVAASLLAAPTILLLLL
ncbi:MAG TPA: M48 family metalloprotease [Glaciibacter sp.]|nr:M48 family metalloprotease [Glaciibacter sp.]